MFNTTPFDPDQSTDDIELFYNNFKLTITTDESVNSCDTIVGVHIEGNMRRIVATDGNLSPILYIPLGEIVCTNGGEIITNYFTSNDIFCDILSGGATPTKIVFYQKP